MLKITGHSGTELDAITLFLEGRLAGPWVEELEAYCSAMALNRQRCPLIDLTGVTFIDADGKALLATLWRQGMELRASGCLTKCVVEEITKAGRIGL
jgi:ABC-type transporter Mla MlaB component